MTKLEYPKKVVLGDITVRDGLQHEDMVVMMDEMGIDTGVDVEKLLAIGRMFERIIGRRLRSECVHTGRIPKNLTGRK